MKRPEGFTYTQIPFERDKREGNTWGIDTRFGFRMTNAAGGRLISRTESGLAASDA